MADYARSLLDKLQGSHRETKDRRRLCYFYAVGLCPRRLLSKTKQSIGACGYEHIQVCLTDAEIKRHELRLLATLVKLYGRHARNIEDAAMKATVTHTPEELEVLARDIAQMINDLPRSKNKIANMSIIEEKKLMLEKMKAKIFVHDGSPSRCRECPGVIGSAASTAWIKRHKSGSIHRAFCLIHRKIGEIAAKYRINDWNELMMLQKRPKPH